MKINYEFVKREIAGDSFLVPVGAAAAAFEGIIILNELGAFIFDRLADCSSAEELAEEIAAVYDTDTQTALRDVEDFFASLGKIGIVVE